MKTYFIRHSSALDVDDITVSLLWDNDYIGIHYPHDSSGRKPYDSKSLEPKDYSGKARHSLALLTDIGENGGYIFGVYRGHAGGKIGIVKPNTKVQLLTGKWGKKNNNVGRDAHLKALKLCNTIELDAFKSLSLTSVQPRQGTLCHWRKVGGRVKDLTLGKVSKEVGSLTPDLQEVMCLEFLRTNTASKLGLPRLLHTLAPVGRTLKDLDILALGYDSKPISAQVTFHHSKSVTAKRKQEKLTPYRKNGGHTILFCKCEEIEQINGHITFPLEIVFNEFCLKSKHGSAWFDAVTQ